jgi:uncharacterized membrane protein
MEPRQTAHRLPRGLQIYLGFVLAVLATFALTAPWQIGGRDVGRFSVVLWAAADLLAAALIVPAWRRALSQLLRGSEVRFSRRAVLLAAALAGLFLCRIVASRWVSLDINASDTTLYADRPIAETLHGNLLRCDFEDHSQLGNHASWLLLAFVPLYAVVASPLWLLLAHALAIAAAAAAGFLLFRSLLKDDLSAAFVAAAFLLNTYTAKAVQYAFHIEIFYPLAVFLLLGALWRRRAVLAGAALVLTLSIKEDSLLPILGIALWLAVFERRLRPAALIGLAAAAVFLFDTRIVMPHFSGSERAWYAGYWASYGDSPSSAAIGILGHPIRAADDVARSGLRDLLEPLLFLPLAGPEGLLAAAPVLVPYAASNNEHISQFSIHYSLAAVPLLFFAAAMGVRRLSSVRSAGVAPERLRKRRRLWALALLLACALDGAGYTFPRARAVRNEIEPVLASIGGRPVRVQGSLYPRAGYARSRLYLDRAPAPEEAVLLCPDTNLYPYTREEMDALVRRLSSDSCYRRTETPGGLLLFTPMN